MNSNNSPPNHYIYGLIDPRDKSLIYIGRTQWPEKRMKEHTYSWSSPRNSTASGSIDKWMRSNDILPEMIILQECTSDEVVEKEKAWIRFASGTGAKVVNCFHAVNNPYKIGANVPKFPRLSRRKNPA